MTVVSHLLYSATLEILVFPEPNKLPIHNRFSQHAKQVDLKANISGQERVPAQENIGKKGETLVPEYTRALRPIQYGKE